MLLEEDRADVGQVDHHVDDGEIGVGELRRDLLQRVAVGEADGDDGVVAAAGEAAQRLLALGVVLDLEIAVVDAGLGLELLGAGIGGLVEGFVELAAEVVDDRRLDRARRAS
jgi:Fe2+ transport system protein FeoA